jgi:peptidoglycan-associated lipoprotein
MTPDIIVWTATRPSSLMGRPRVGSDVNRGNHTMSKKKIALILCLVLTLVVFAPACKKKKAGDTVPDPDAQQQVATPEPSEEEPAPSEQIEDFKSAEPEVRQIDQSAAAINDRGELKTIYFGYDKDELTDAGRATLRQNANWLKANPQWNLVLKGHCDERGTIEYNLALGQRRGNSVRSYMASLGVDASRVRTVSYGEERPEDNGHNEAAWAKNRRAESEVEDR